VGRDQPAATGTEEQAESAPLARWEAARDEAEQERGRRQAAEERVERLTALLARERELRQEAQREARALGAQLGSAPAEVLVRRRRRRIRRVPLLRRLRRRPQRPAQLG
jgi:hypothetical protein